MNSQQRRTATQAFKETQQAIAALQQAHQVVEITPVEVGDTYNGEEQTAPSVVIRFFPRFDGTAEFEAIRDSLTVTTP